MQTSKGSIDGGAQINKEVSSSFEDLVDLVVNILSVFGPILLSKMNFICVLSSK